MLRSIYSLVNHGGDETHSIVLTMTEITCPKCNGQMVPAIVRNPSGVPERVCPLCLFSIDAPPQITLAWKPDTRRKVPTWLGVLILAVVAAIAYLVLNTVL